MEAQFVPPKIPKPWRQGLAGIVRTNGAFFGGEKEKKKKEDGCEGERRRDNAPMRSETLKAPAPPVPSSHFSFAS